MKDFKSLVYKFSKRGICTVLSNTFSQKGYINSQEQVIFLFCLIQILMLVHYFILDTSN